MRITAALSILVIVLSSMVVGAIFHRAYLKDLKPAQIPLVEQQILDYKKAEAICGKDNVKSYQKCLKEDGCESSNELADPEYVCDDLGFAAMDEASKSAEYSYRMQGRVKSYCNYIREAGNDPIPFSL